MAESPFFSIVIPTYNRAHLIGKTIQSVLQQDLKHFELLVIDDGSTDQTEKVVREFTDSRVKYYRKENGERGAARNYGVRYSKGDYVNFLDSDDLLYFNHLTVAAKIIADLNHPEFFHLAYDYQLVDGSTLHVNNFDNSIDQILLFDNKLSCHGVFLRKDIAVAFPFEENRVLASSEDWELWIRLLCRYKLHYSNEITSAVINHELRSLHTIPADRVVARDLFLIEKIKEDEMVMRRYGTSFNRFVAERYTFFMLSMANQRRRGEVLKWGFRAFKVHPVILGSKRFLASIKNVILK